MTLLPWQPRMAGLPGFMAMPWYSTSPSSRMTRAEKSSRPAEEPAFRMTISHSEAALATMALIWSNLSGTMGYTFASAPHCRTMAEKMEPLNSRISPGLGSVQGGIISSPVGMMPTTGLRMTSISSTPPAIMAPMAEGETVIWEGRIISPAQISSPIWRMCCQGAAAAWMVMVPSSFFTISSTMMTASQPSGMGSPVSRTMN